MPNRQRRVPHLLALEPIAETTADPNSYGFRPERASRDAIEQCFITLSRRNSVSAGPPGFGGPSPHYSEARPTVLCPTRGTGAVGVGPTRRTPYATTNCSDASLWGAVSAHQASPEEGLCLCRHDPWLAAGAKPASHAPEVPPGVLRGGSAGRQELTPHVLSKSPAHRRLSLLTNQKLVWTSISRKREPERCALDRRGEQDESKNKSWSSGGDRTASRHRLASHGALFGKHVFHCLCRRARHP